MSDKPDIKPEVKTGTKPEPVAEPVAVPKKGWSNPALRMMGIPKVSLPSRNWMIFWSVLASIGGGIAYDKYQQKQVRKAYMAQVEHLGKEVYASDRLPRKLTVFIAPPPDDFLDKSMSYFKQFIKPILNSASIDFDILVASKQGDIRTSVSERIRQLRRDQLQQEKQAQKHLQQAKYEKSWTKFVTVTVPYILKAPFKSKEEVVEELKSYKDILDTKDLLGYYYKYDPIVPVKDDALEPEKAGGVVCLGRGAYKEYIQGVHEGLLGPLDPPKIEPKVEPKVEDPVTPIESVDSSAPVTPVTPVPVTPIPADNLEPEVEGQEKKDETPVPPPYISPSDYSKAQLAPELNFNTTIKDSKNVPVIFEQPIYVFPIPNLLGFKTMPKKIYRYFTKREQAQEFSERTLRIVDGKSRPFEFKDQYLAKEEEMLWPKKWVEKGIEKNSEWVQEMVVDDRVISRLKVYVYE